MGSFPHETHLMTDLWPYRDDHAPSSVKDLIAECDDSL
jgi:hypothetical protein